MESECFQLREMFSHGKRCVKWKKTCSWYKVCRNVFQTFCVSIFGPEFLHWGVKRATEGSGEMDGGWWEERSERYSLTEWRLMSLSCLTKPLLIPPGLWMFRDVSDVNNQCQSSAVTFDRCRSVVFGPVVYLFVRTVQYVCESFYRHVCIFIWLYAFLTCCYGCVCNLNVKCDT